MFIKSQPRSLGVVMWLLQIYSHLCTHLVNNCWVPMESPCKHFAILALAFILPPASVGLRMGCGHLGINNILMCLLLWVPGILHALYVISKCWQNTSVIDYNGILWSNEGVGNGYLTCFNKVDWQMAIQWKISVNWIVALMV